MDLPALFWVAAKVVLLIVGLLAPGDALMRALGVPRTLGLGFAGSVVLHYASVLLLQLLGVRISPASLTTTLALLTAVAVLAARMRRRRAEPVEREGIWCFRMGAWTPLYLLFWAAVLFRLWREPLAGPDVEFRWSFLAEQMLRIGSLDFYPPQRAADFVSYFWVESIPPGSSALHAWAYACAGSAAPVWTIPAVALQLWSIHELIWRTAERVGGLLAARCACLGAAACPLLTWSTLLGQETGLTALALIGIVFALHRSRETGESSWAALAGVFAAIGASAREYGMVFPAIAGAGLLVLRANGPAWRAFAPIAALSIAWPLRSWLLTGHPFYSLPLRGFPVNERFVAWIEHEAVAFGAVLQSVSGWAQAARYLGLYAGVAFVGWLALIVATFRRRPAAGIALAAVGIVLVLWISSVRYTNGGLFYSLRVTSPALAVGALVFGIAAAAVSLGRPARLLGAQITSAVLLLATLPATLALPQNPRSLAWREWVRTQPAPLPNARTDPTVAIVLQALGAPEARQRRVIIADAPGYQRRFAGSDVTVVPLWSPQVDWLFDETLSRGETVRRWRESGVSHLVLTKWQSNLDFLNTRSRWARPPFQVDLVGETKLTAIFSVRATE